MQNIIIITGRAIVAAGLVAGSVGCTRDQSPQEIREKTANATAELKQNAKAMAQGVREGWSRDKPLDLNKATEDQLQELPGVNRTKADQIIAGRPFDDPHQLVTRRILSEIEYGKIADKVVVKR
jgi:DNA uptake protein ComE-like DNA-binding protein